MAHIIVNVVNGIAVAAAAARTRISEFAKVQAAADFPTDFLPFKLLVNHGWIRAERDRLDAAGDDTVIVLHQLVRPTGGCEHRPMGRFDRLPAGARPFFVLSPTHAKPTYLRLADTDALLSTDFEVDAPEAAPAAPEAAPAPAPKGRSRKGGKGR